MGLKKELNGLGVFSLAAGAMISSGLFVLPAVAYQSAKEGMLLSYLLAGIMVLPALFSQLEIATAIPKAGGTYFFIERILGTAPGVTAGFADWFSISLKSAFALIGIGAFATLVFPGITPIQIKLISATGCIIFMLINILGAKESVMIQNIIVAFLIVILVQFVTVGYRIMDFSPILNVTSFNWNQIFATTGMVFISYGGITTVASMSEEVKNPGKNLVWGAIAAFVVVQILYLLIIAIIVGTVKDTHLIKSLTPVSDAGMAFAPGKPLGQFQMIVTAVAAMLAFITTANAGIMSASRTPLAMARDGLISDKLASVTKKGKTPVISILMTSAFILTVLFVLDLENLAKVASLFMILLFLLINVSVIVIRTSKIGNYKPSFKSPFFPVLQIIGICFYIFLIIQMGWITISIAAGFILLTLTWWFFYARKKVKRKSAFVHMVEKVTAPELIGDIVELEEELLDILQERNEIQEDRFDLIIRQSLVIDYTETTTREELFSRVSKEVGEKWGMPPHAIELKLQYREEQSSTLIYPGVAVPHAIPHIVVEGSHKFDIVLVRNKYGIVWNEAGDVVYTAFVLIGTRDERNFHLRALMAIAQILQDPDFHAEWMKAKTNKDLRAVILLTKRNREKK